MKGKLIFLFTNVIYCRTLISFAKYYEKTFVPSINTCSTEFLTSKGLPLQITKSASLPSSIEPTRSLTPIRSEEHTSELQSRGHLVCRLLLEKKKQTRTT